MYTCGFHEIIEGWTICEKRHYVWGKKSLLKYLFGKKRKTNYAAS